MNTWDEKVSKAISYQQSARTKSKLNVKLANSTERRGSLVL
jgi:hypothetical protein